jgi:indoleamine 2,3-dioxygenase
MSWNINARGFLPPNDPLETLCTINYEYAPLNNTLENISVILPNLLDERLVREELVSQLRTPGIYEDSYFSGLTGDYAERVMLIYSYMASAYVYARQENPANRIPKEISIPLVAVAQKVGRPPILSYASYCLFNWRRLDINKPIELGNIELLQNFCGDKSGKRDEDWFILVHVDIEAKAAEAINTIMDIFAHPNVNILTLVLDLEKIVCSLTNMNNTLKRMTEFCDPDNYYRWVRPYIFGFKNVVYEGCFDNQPQTFRGETGAQSSIVPMMIAALGIKHVDTMLTQHLKEMRDYMPPQHRLFLQNLEARSANNNLRTAANTPKLKKLYNECMQQLLEFRSTHFNYAVNYIAQKVDNPEGTGGTPYVPWLQQLRDETQAQILPD